MDRTNNSTSASTNLLPRSCLIKLQAVYDSLKTAEKKAADFLLQNAEVIAGGTIVNASELSGSSGTTWFRLAKRIGYTGFLEMREDIAKHLEHATESPEPPLLLYEGVTADDSVVEVARKVFSSSVSALNDTINLLNADEYEKAVQALLDAKSIVISGVGDAYAVAHSVYQRFFRAGFNAFLNSDYDLQLIAASRLKPGDVLIVISYSGRTKNILELVKHAKGNGITIIAITNFPHSALTKNSDIVLLTAAFTKHAQGEIASKRITQLCIIESLYINVLIRAGETLSNQLAISNQALELNKL